MVASIVSVEDHLLALFMQQYSCNYFEKMANSYG